MAPNKNKKKTSSKYNTNLVPGIGRLPYPAYQGEEPYIFVSYCHMDSERVFEEIRRFNEAGYHVWYDEGIDPGNEWPDEIANALENCALFVVFLTKNSVQSQNVSDEINFVLDEQTPAVAIYLEECELRGGLKLRFKQKQAILKYNLSEEEYNYKYIKAFDHLGVQRTEPQIPITDAARRTERFSAPRPDAAIAKGRKPLYIKITAAVIAAALILTAVAVLSKKTETTRESLNAYVGESQNRSAGDSQDPFAGGSLHAAVGEIIRFGSYPQSEIRDEALIRTLNQQDGAWKSYRYFSGTGEWYDGRMAASDYMRYKDVDFDGGKYRAVTFDSYRPYCAGYASDADSSNQDEYGYETGKVYWFQFEPLQWRVLDPDKGLVLCETVIDCQPYNNYLVLTADEKFWGDPDMTCYANDYAASSIRAWLNNDFYNTAFSAAEKANICATVLNNDGWYTLNGQSGYEEYDAADTNDKVFLLSWDEVTNSAYGFAAASANDAARQTKGSDYAKCQGLCVNGSFDLAFWRLRSPGDDSNRACDVNDNGDASDGCDTDRTDDGIRPALELKSITE